MIRPLITKRLHEEGQARQVAGNQTGKYSLLHQRPIIIPKVHQRAIYKLHLQLAAARRGRRRNHNALPILWVMHHIKGLPCSSGAARLSG